MKQKFITVLFAATLFLLGLAGTVKAQGHRSPWIAKWDSCILDIGDGYYRPNRPVGPYFIMPPTGQLCASMRTALYT